MLSRLSLTFSLLALIAACSSNTPHQTLDNYANALSSGDGVKAYSLLDAELKEEISEEDYIKRFERLEKSSSELKNALSNSADEAAYVDASLPYTEFDTLSLSLTHDGWVINDGLFNFYGQRTEREALYSFIKALENKKYDVLMRFIPESYAKHMDTDKVKEYFESDPKRVDEMLALLKQNRDNLIHSQGSRAHMDYGPYTIDFVKEGGLWKIQDAD